MARPAGSEGAAGLGMGPEAGADRLVFIELPPGLARELGTFHPDPSIPLPVEPAGDPSRFDPRGLTAEAIIAGMLRLLAWAPGHEHAAYYRSFVRAARPELLVELSQAGVAKARQKDWAVAEEIFRALSGVYPEAPEPLLDLAVLYEDRAQGLEDAGRAEAAEEYEGRAFDAYKRLLALEPPFAEGFFNAAFFFLRRRNYERARGLLETYIEIGDDAGRKARAREIIGKLEEQGLLDTLFKEAYDFIRLGRDEEGLAKAREFVGRNPKFWNGWFLVGWANRRLGRWEEGRAAFEKALELGSDGVDALNELSLCLIELGRLPEARAALEKALRAEPENVKIITNLGALAIKTGRTGEAAAFFRTALDLEPEDQAAADWLRRIEGGG